MSHYNVRKKYIQFLKTSNTCVNYLEENNFRKLKSKSFIFQTGVINKFWQSWSFFWRTYWLAEVLGGIDIENKRIVPHNSTLSEKQAVYFLLNGTTGNSTEPYNEKTWGARKTLEKIALKMYQIDGSPFPTVPISIKGQNLLSAISLLGNSIDHLQIVRNCSVHLDTHTAIQCKSILPYYSYKVYKYPTDLLFANTLVDGKKTIISWHEELNTLLTLV